MRRRQAASGAGGAGESVWGRGWGGGGLEATRGHARERGRERRHDAPLLVLCVVDDQVLVDLQGRERAERERLRHGAHSTAQHCTAQHSTAQHSTAHSTHVPRYDRPRRWGLPRISLVPPRSSRSDSSRPHGKGERGDEEKDGEEGGGEERGGEGSQGLQRGP